MAVKIRQKQWELLTRERGISRCSENWVDVLYKYADGWPVPQASYLVADASSSFKKSGTLDDAGSAHVSLPDNVLNVTITFSNDPQEVVLLRKPEAHGEVVEQGWFDKLVSGITSSGRAVWDALKGAMVWVWEVVQGDFNEDASVAQIITGTVITLIPVVDQVGDVRDIVANLKKLIWDKRYNEVGVWAALVLTLIGAIPELGSLLKGACKSIYRGAKLDELFKVINGLAHTNAKKWLKKLLAEISTHSAAVTKMLLGILDEVQVKLAKLLDKLPVALTSFRKKISEVLVTLAEVRAQAARRVKEVFDDITEKLRRLLGEKEPAKTGGATRQEHLLQQKATPPEGPLGGGALVGPKKPIAFITPGSLPAEEEAAVLDTLRHIDAGTKPTGKLKKKWGADFNNKRGDLPGVAGEGKGRYKEYRVQSGPGVSGAGDRRIVVDETDRSVYYTWTHYGEPFPGLPTDPAFVRIR